MSAGKTCLKFGKENVMNVMNYFFFTLLNPASRDIRSANVFNGVADFLTRFSRNEIQP